MKSLDKPKFIDKEYKYYSVPLNLAMRLSNHCFNPVYFQLDLEDTRLWRLTSYQGIIHERVKI